MASLHSLLSSSRFLYKPTSLPLPNHTYPFISLLNAAFPSQNDRNSNGYMGQQQPQTRLSQQLSFKTTPYRKSRSKKKLTNLFFQLTSYLKSSSELDTRYGDFSVHM